MTGRRRVTGEEFLVLLRRHRLGDPTAAVAILDALRPMIARRAWQWASKVEFEDLMQQGALAVLQVLPRLRLSVHGPIRYCNMIVRSALYGYIVHGCRASEPLKFLMTNRIVPAARVTSIGGDPFLLDRAIYFAARKRAGGWL